MGLFERYLTLWVALCIVAGVALGHVMPGFFAAVATAEVAKVNLPVAALIWLMIVPMLLKIDFGSLGQVREHWRGVGVTLFINWAVKPFSMALLSSFFIGHVFAPMLPAGQIPSYIAGLILLAAAPCTAMVFVWSNLCEGEPHYTLSQVALNDVIMVFLFAPLVGLLLGVASISVPWGTLLLSVLLYIVVPVIVAQVWRRVLLQKGGDALPYAPSLFVLATVTSINRLGEFTVDAGVKALAFNGPMPSKIIGVPDGSTYRFGGDEHGMITMPEGCIAPKLGSRVLILSTHCDPTVNLHSQYHVIGANRRMKKWPVMARYGF